VRFSLLLVAVALLLTACPTIEERPVSDVQLHFDADLRDGFWSMPWPNDARTLPARRAGGRHPDLWPFPNPEDRQIVNQYILYGSTRTEGFGLNSPTYFWFDGAIVLPRFNDDLARASMRCEGPVRIVNVDRDSSRYGDCVPARWEIAEEAGDDLWLEDNLVMVAPYWGFPLDSGTTYAIYLVDVKDPAEDFVRPPRRLGDLLSGTSGDASLQAAYAPLAEYLESSAPPEAVDPPGTWVAAATVFTTQDLIDEMDRLADFVRADVTYPAWNEDEGLTLLDSDHPRYQTQFDLYDGSYVAWNFEEGEIPYASEGGGFVWDDAGQPVPQSAERIPFVLGTPIPSATQPPNGWPVILHGHGTTGDRYSHFDGGSLRPALMGAARGFVSIGIPQPIHGERWPGGNEALERLYSFNYFNPAAGLSMFRQAAIDTISLLRFVEENLAEGGPIAEAYPDLRIDPENIYYLGHSQGGLTGAIALPFAEGIKGWVLSGTGAGLSLTIMQRTDPLDIAQTLETGIGAPPGALFEMHPVVGMVQSLAEPTDTMNYAPYWVAQSDRSPASVLLTEGLHDADTPADSAEALAVAGRLPIVDSFHVRDVAGLELRGLEPLDEPYSGNLQHPSGELVTSGLAQFDTGHFAIFQETEAAQLWSNFLYSMVRDGAPGEIGASFP